MLNLKKTLLGSAMALSCLTMGNLAHADESQDQTTSSQSNMGLYLELGGGFSMSNMFDATQDDEELVIGKSGGFASGIGIKFNSFSAGIDVLNSSPDMVVTSGSGDSETIGTASVTVILAKITGEHSFDDHNTIFTSLGLGSAMYNVDGANGEGKISPDYNNLAFMVGIGYKAYFGKRKGLYLSADVRYTKILQDTLEFTGDYVAGSLTGGLGMAQGVIKLGYQF